MGIATTTTRILDAAEQLAQTNGFSYADIAAMVKMQKPSLHHHFPSKVDLGVALIERYHETFFAISREFDTEVPAPPCAPRALRRPLPERANSN